MIQNRKSVTERIREYRQREGTKFDQIRAELAAVRERQDLTLKLLRKSIGDHETQRNAD